MKVEIDGVEYRQPAETTLRAAAELRELYCKIWTEACYDSTNEATQNFALKLLPHIKKLNQIIGFKK